MSPESIPTQEPSLNVEPDRASIEETVSYDALASPRPNANRLSPAFVEVERLIWWILTAVFGIVTLVAWLIVGFLVRDFDLFQWLSLAGIATVVAIGLWASFFFPSRTYEATTWLLSDLGIEIRKGIWWKHCIFVPRERIQHADVNQGPLMRVYGLATLVINTGGTHEPSIELSGLSHGTAMTVRDSLVKRSNARHA